MWPLARGLLPGLLAVCALAGQEAGLERGLEKDHSVSDSDHSGRQTPEELGFTSDGDVDEGDGGLGQRRFAEGRCLDLGAKGFPLPVFQMLQSVDWSAQKYFEMVQVKGYAEDALQMTGPQEAVLKTDCMKASFRGKTKHIFVGDSQMMSLRNAFHRLSRCPEIWWSNATEQQKLQLRAGRRLLLQAGRTHSSTEQAPADAALPAGCSEEGFASFIYWDAWAHREVPVEEIEKEVEQLGLQPKEGDNVVVWVGSNFVSAARRMGVLTDTINKMHSLGVKMVWDSPTYQDVALMTASSTHNSGRDPHSAVPITYTNIGQRKVTGSLGSNLYRTEKALAKSGVEIPMTRRWQLTNRYRGLQCDGMHTDMRARDPLFYNAPCPGADGEAYGRSARCNWVEPFKAELEPSCPSASGIDDLVLQSGLYSLCAAHERPFCYQHTEAIR